MPVNAFTAPAFPQSLNCSCYSVEAIGLYLALSASQNEAAVIHCGLRAKFRAHSKQPQETVWSEDIEGTGRAGHTYTQYKKGEKERRNEGPLNLGGTKTISLLERARVRLLLFG